MCWRFTSAAVMFISVRHKHIKMNKLILITFLLCFNFFSCNGQEESSSEVFLDYFPERRDGVTNERYRKGINSLTNTYEAIKKDSNTFVYADHVNIMDAYKALKEPKEKVLEQLRLAQEKDMMSTAEIFLMMMDRDYFIGYLTDVEYDSLHHKFTKVLASKKEVELDLQAYAKEGGYDFALVNLMAHLEKTDQTHRGSDSDFSKQPAIDAENIRIIDSLFNYHKTYIGKTLVGDDFKSVMWAVIQHSDLVHQEEYLPIVHQAVKNNDLPEAPLKMLIDRVYGKKYGYQIFGSQGHELASDEIISEVKKKYQLN